MYKIQASINGLAPLRYNRFLVQGKESSNKKKMTHEDQMQDALNRSYFDEEKGFYVPKAALRACLINGGKKVKVGRGAASKSLEAILIFEEEKYFLGTKDYKVQQDVVRIPPKTGARIVQYWAVVEEWSLNFSAVILDAVFPSEAIKESIEYAGMYYGLLDGRPQLGRFQLKDFKKEKM